MVTTKVKPEVKTGIRWVIAYWMKCRDGSSAWHFAAIDIDWKPFIDGKTESFEKWADAKAHVMSYPMCYPPDVEFKLMGDVPFPATF